jgi:hypothetical protein
LGMAKPACGSKFLDSLVRMTLHGKSVQAWRVGHAMMSRYTRLKLAWSGHSATDNPV